MSSAEVASGVGRLREALEQLEQAWGATQELWRDGNSRHFEEEQLRPIAARVRDAYSVIQRLADILKQAERDCEPW